MHVKIRLSSEIRQLVLIANDPQQDKDRMIGKEEPMASQNIPSRCPACGNALAIEILRCPVCRTAVEGHYALSRFLLLAPEQMQFCELFLRCRGSLKDVGAMLGISYPTARNRLDDLVQALGYEGQSVKDERLDVLERLTRGEISHEQALRLLKGEELS
jgi:hypothetical protein